MPDDFKNDENVMLADSGHPWSRRGAWEFEPISSKPQIADWAPEDFLRGDTPAACDARALGRMRNDDYASGFHARIAWDHRTYLIVSITLALSLVLMLGGLWFYRSTAPEIAVDQWCADFRYALSCPNAQSNAGN